MQDDEDGIGKSCILILLISCFGPEHGPISDQWWVQTDRHKSEHGNQRKGKKHVYPTH